MFYVYTMSNHNSIETLEQWKKLEKSNDQVKDKVLNPIKRITHDVLYTLSWQKRKEKKQEKLEKEEALKREQDFRRRQEEKRRQIEADKYFESYKNFVDWEISNYIEQFIPEIEEFNKNIEEKNTTCPNCGSKNVVNRIWNTVWRVHWWVDWNVVWKWSIWWNLLFWVYGSSWVRWEVHWEINWETETLPISHCNDCSNEWKKENKRSTSIKEILKDKDYIIGVFIWYIEKYLEWEYDDILIDDEKARKEGAAKTFFNEIWDIYTYLKDLSIESLAYLYAAKHTNYYFLRETYEYKLPDNIVEILKFLWFQYWFEDK